ncbi:MAG: hypothetical protein ABI416_19530 [Ginsengibacter sp.]
MNFKITNRTKIFIVLICFIAAVVVFLVRLPSGFRHADKGLHFAFYFLAAAFLNILFNTRNFVKHISVSGFLYLFGIGIEFAQENYNKVFHVHFHGRYDPEDVKANLRGLIAFSILWAIVMLCMYALRFTKRTAA